VVAMEEDRCLMVSHAVAEVTKPNNRWVSSSEHTRQTRHLVL
jgi:hypothetical protein